MPNQETKDFNESMYYQPGKRLPYKIFFYQTNILLKSNFQFDGDDFLFNAQQMIFNFKLVR